MAAGSKARMAVSHAAAPNLAAPIEAIEAFIVQVPLDEPLLVFGQTITARDYVFARVAAGGHIGTGYAFMRGGAIDRAVQKQIAPLVVGQPVGSIRAIWNAARSAVRMIGEGGIYARALAVVDIALWDLVGHTLGVPLWRLLGGVSAEIPCMAIMGYYQPMDSVAALRGEAERLALAGYTRFKVPVGLNRELDAQRLATLREVVGPSAQIGVDAGAAFNTVKEVLAVWRALEAYDLAFFEDPFPATAPELACELAAQLPIPVAFGEALSSPAYMQTLGCRGGVDIVRPDATHQLGITGYMQGVATALERSVPIFPHYFPDIHAPLVGALGGLAVEESPREAETTGFLRLRAVAPRIIGGMWHLSERAGLGIEWDETAIAAHRIGGT